METGTVEEFTEDLGHLTLDDARAVVLHQEPVLVAFSLLHLDQDIWKHRGLLTGIQSVVHTFLHRGK